MKRRRFTEEFERRFSPKFNDPVHGFGGLQKTNESWPLVAERRIRLFEILAYISFGGFAQ